MVWLCLDCALGVMGLQDGQCWMRTHFSVQEQSDWNDKGIFLY